MNISTLTRLTADVATTEPAIWLVILMGMAIVFVGLLCIVVVCKLTSGIFGTSNKTTKQPTAAPAPQAAAPVAAPQAATIPNRGAFIAAVATAIAEDLGTDVSAIRILSVKKV